MEKRKIPNTIIKIKCNDYMELFKSWLVFTRPYHNLSDKEIDITAAFLYNRHKLSEAIIDDTILDSVCMSDDAKKDVRELCNLSVQHFQVMLSKLRRKGIIKDNRLNPRIIPSISNGGIDNYQLLYVFTVDAGDSNIKANSQET